jgi:hypothetical protein
MVVNVSIVDRVKDLLLLVTENMIVSGAGELWFGWNYRGTKD